MQIRAARREDIPRIVQLGAMMHQESPRYRDITYSADKVEAQALSCIVEDYGIAYVVLTMEEEIVGFMFGGVLEFFFSDARYASDFALYMTPEYRGHHITPMLVTVFEQEAKAKGAIECAPGISTGFKPDQVRKFYEALGYNTAGYCFVKAL